VFVLFQPLLVCKNLLTTDPLMGHEKKQYSSFNFHDGSRTVATPVIPFMDNSPGSKNSRKDDENRNVFFIWWLKFLQHFRKMRYTC